MHERILVPLDGSAAAEAALAYVELIPSRCVRLFAVEPDERGPMLASAPEFEEWRSERTRSLRNFLEPAGEGLRRQGRAVETAVAFGDPAERIVAAAADADLIAMTTHGRGAGGRALFGSVADRVARHAPAATLVVRGGPRPAAAPPLTRLVVPLDGSARAEQALPVAVQLAGDLGVPLHLVRAVEHDLTPATVGPRVVAAMPSAGAAVSAAHQAEAYLAEQVRRLRGQDLVATSEVLAGLPALALLDAIRPGDVVVMTTRGLGGVRRWLLGSVAEKLVHAAPAPILLVRAGTSGRPRRDTGRSDQPPS